MRRTLAPDEEAERLLLRCKAEGFLLALRVVAGAVTRAQVEEAFEHYGDIEPAIALECLDRWGWKS